MSAEALVREKIRAIVIEGKLSLVAAALLSLATYFLCTRTLPSGSELYARQGCIATALFLLLFTALRIFSHTLSLQLHRVTVSLDGEAVSSRSVRIFVIYKELVKIAVGVSLSLAWIAGLLFIAETFAASIVLVPLFYALGFSALLFAVTYGFVSFVDLIPYPFSR